MLLMAADPAKPAWPLTSRPGGSGGVADPAMLHAANRRERDRRSQPHAIQPKLILVPGACRQAAFWQPGHRFPDADDLGRGTIDTVLGEVLAAQERDQNAR
jgi:hypothetical protein